MEIRQVSVETCHEVTGAVVVIDVLRAFSTAAYALAAGAQDIVLVGTVEEALALRTNMPGALAMGEVNGLPVPGFDFDNSPTQFDQLNLTGRRLIQRSTAGTQGAVRSTGADTLLVTGFPCAGATVRYLRRLSPPAVTFVITGMLQDLDGDEDAACADYMTALLAGKSPDLTPYLQRVYVSTSGRLFADPAKPEFSAADLAYCTAVDRFDFAMPAERRNGLLVVTTVRPPAS
jgi:2-phosphosulfolactate phosphatase